MGVATPRSAPRQQTPTSLPTTAGLSRRLLLLAQQGRDAVPIDLLLGCMSPELQRIMGDALPPHVLDFFSNSLPHPLLASLVFAEFTHVGPMPAGKGIDSGSDDDEEEQQGDVGGLLSLERKNSQSAPVSYDLSA
jgi:hypothetical protein